MRRSENNTLNNTLNAGSYRNYTADIHTYIRTTSPKGLSKAK